MNSVAAKTESPLMFHVGGANFKFLDPTDAVAVETMPGCIYEPTTTTLLQRLLAGKDLTFLDVGAHYGYFACYAGALNSKLKILAFEPGEKHAAVLDQNVALNGLENVRVLRYALSDQTCEAPFTDRTMKLKPGFEIEKISAVTLDELSKSMGFRPDIVKVDVHGAEGKVFGGMLESLRDHVQIVLAEIHAEHILVDYNHRQILDMLKQSDFYIYECVNFRRLSEPKLSILQDYTYDMFVDPSQWSEDQVKNERMILASKKQM